MTPEGHLALVLERERAWPVTDQLVAHGEAERRSVGSQGVADEVAATELDALAGFAVSIHALFCACCRAISVALLVQVGDEFGIALGDAGIAFGNRPQFLADLRGPGLSDTVEGSAEGAIVACKLNKRQVLKLSGQTIAAARGRTADRRRVRKIELNARQAAELATLQQPLGPIDGARCRVLNAGRALFEERHGVGAMP